MNKRDVIILAVLLNTGLLSALAMVAIHTDDQAFVDPTEINRIMVDHHTNKTFEKDEVIASTLVATDEWDSVLKDYVTSTSQLNLDDNIDEFEKEFEEPKKIVKETPKKTVQKEIAKEVPKELIKIAVKEPVKEVVKPIVKETVKPAIKETRGVGKTIEITVKKGDALEKIARANGTSVEQVRALNNLKNDRLTIGQVLLVPVGSEVAVVPALAAPKAASKANEGQDEVEYYIIKSGDNPWKIAKQFKVKFDDLLKMNHLDEEKARNLKIGDRIRVK